MSATAPVWGIVLGSGSGTRFGGAKQFADLHGKPLLQHAIDAARTVCAGVVAVVPDPFDPAVAALRGVDAVVAGGAVRAASARAGLAAVPPDAGIVVVADAAHPLASPALFAAVVAAVAGGADGAFPALPLLDAVAEVRPDGSRGGAVERAGRVVVQTPHAFRAELFRAAHAGPTDAVEDTELVAAARRPDGSPTRVVAVPGEPLNLHVARPADLAAVRAVPPVAGPGTGGNALDPDVA